MMTREEQSARDKAALTDEDRRKIAHASSRNHYRRARDFERAERSAERTRLANVLATYRRVEWDGHRAPVRDLLDGSIVGYVPPPWWQRHRGPSPLVTRAEPVPRVRERGSYTRELVRATTRGHDHVPERPRS
jgi:hypothetical protein